MFILLAVENANGPKSSVTWTTQRNSIFMERFGSYVRKEESAPFPSKSYIFTKYYI